MSGENNNTDRSLEEWKASMESIGRFDGTLVDLRKYGFTFITGLVTAQGFLGYALPSTLVRTSVIVVTMTLIVILYWMDKYYYSLLYGAAVRVSFLENIRMPDVKLSTFTGGFNHKFGKTILDYIYFGFLIGLLILALAVIFTDNNIDWTKIKLEGFGKTKGELLLISITFVVSVVAIWIAKQTLHDRIYDLEKDIKPIIKNLKSSIRDGNIGDKKSRDTENMIRVAENEIAEKLDEFSNLHFTGIMSKLSLKGQKNPKKIIDKDALPSD